MPLKNAKLPFGFHIVRFRIKTRNTTHTVRILQEGCLTWSFRAQMGQRAKNVQPAKTLQNVHVNYLVPAIYIVLLLAPGFNQQK